MECSDERVWQPLWTTIRGNDIRQLKRLSVTFANSAYGSRSLLPIPLSPEPFFYPPQLTELTLMRYPLIWPLGPVYSNLRVLRLANFTSRDCVDWATFAPLLRSVPRLQFLQTRNLLWKNIPAERVPVVLPELRTLETTCRNFSCVAMIAQIDAPRLARLGVEMFSSEISAVANIVRQSWPGVVGLKLKVDSITESEVRLLLDAMRQLQHIDFSGNGPRVFKTVMDAMRRGTLVMASLRSMTVTHTVSVAYTQTLFEGSNRPVAAGFQLLEYSDTDEDVVIQWSGPFLRSRAIVSHDSPSISCQWNRVI